MLDLSLIRTDASTQSRVSLDENIVAEYAELYLSGAEFPPVTIFFDGSDRWLADGFHRFFGAKKAGRTSILETIIPGTLRDAKLYSFGANRMHGHRPTNADKRFSVQKMLEDAEWSAWSDRKIGETCGVSVSFVSSVRRPEVSEKQKQSKTKEKPQHEKGCSRTTPLQIVGSITEEIPEDNSELEAALDSNSSLIADNARLSAELAVSNMGSVPESDKNQAADLIEQLSEENKKLRSNIAAVTMSRDALMEENAQMKIQMSMQRKEIAKLKSN